MVTRRHWAITRILPPSSRSNDKPMRTSVARRIFAGVVVATFILFLSELSVLRPISAQTSSGKSSPDRAELIRLSRDLREGNSTSTYAALRDFAEKNSGSTLGARAALALGFADYEKKRHADAQKWFALALKDVVLRPYARYWLAQSQIASKDLPHALEQLEMICKDAADSVASELALDPLTSTAIALGKPERALAAFDAFGKVDTKSGLILLRAQALEKANKLTAAAKAYQIVYYKFPLSPTAQTAGSRLKELQKRLKGEFPQASGELEIARAESFYTARKWKESRDEYNRLVTKLKGDAREPAVLRLAQSKAQLEKKPAALEKLKLNRPELEAERWYSISQSQRAKKNEAGMLAAIERVANNFPDSEWAEESLFSAGNYFWMKLDRVQAAKFYRRVWKQSPNGKNAQAAQWRVAWSEYLQSDANAAASIEEHLKKFPGSIYTANALYWRGRAAESAQDIPLARAFYSKLMLAFPRAYFSAQGAERLKTIGEGPMGSSDVLSHVQAPPALAFHGEIPAGAKRAWERAQALHEIGFDATEELELRAAHAANPAPRLLLEVAKSALESGRFLPAIAAARQAVPQIETRRYEDIPEDVWRTIYPLMYREGIEENAARVGLDPMMVAGLIRQESVFETRAVSRVGALGLMQLNPPTGKALAKKEKLKFSKARLFEPAFNLRLGTIELARLKQNLGGWEPALAAYNAGPGRVAQWQAERKYSEPAEFVESIPITETREYVQVVIRNAEMYRTIYGRKIAGSQGQ